MNFDELRRQAEQHFGKDLVDRAEVAVRLKVDRDNMEKHAFEVEDVEFRREMEALASEATQRLTASKQPPEPTKSSANKFAALDQVKEEYAAKDFPLKDSAFQQRERANTGISDSVSHSAELLKMMIHREYLYGMIGLALGLACILAGVVLGLNGVAGSTSWTASVLGLESQINDATPGVVVFVVGVFMIWITKPRIKMKNLKG